MKIFLIMTAAILSLTSVGADVGNDAIATKTPCPYLNWFIAHQIEEGNLSTDADTIPRDLLVDCSVAVGIDKHVIKLLARGRDNGCRAVDIDELLNPNKFPAHRGSLARVDAQSAEEFARVDVDKLNALTTSSVFSVERTVNGRVVKFISYDMLQKFQQDYVWSLSEEVGPLSCKDKIVAKAELELLWSLFGGYRAFDHDGTPMIELSLVDNFLRHGKLPDDFKPNTDDAASVLDLVKSIFR